MQKLLGVHCVGPGSVDTCYLKSNRKHKGNRSFFKMTHFDENSTELSMISSDATHVCICNRSHLHDCTIYLTVLLLLTQVRLHGLALLLLGKD